MHWSWKLVSVELLKELSVLCMESSKLRSGEYDRNKWLGVECWLLIKTVEDSDEGKVKKDKDLVTVLESKF